MTHEPPQAASRWLKAVGLLLLATAALAVAGCGSDTPAVCDSLETLSSNVAGLQDISLEDGGEAAVADLEESFDSIQSDLEAVKTDAEAELSEPIAGLESSVDALSTQVAAVTTAGGISAESITALGEAVAAVGTSLEALKTAVPDCDL